MLLRRALPLLLLLSATALYGQSFFPLAIDPPDPTSRDEITVLVRQFSSCPPPPGVTRSGSEIVLMLRAGSCASPPALITHRVELGALPAGQYRVTVIEDGVARPGSFSFTVLDENWTVRVAQPIGSTEGGLTVTVSIDGSLCMNAGPGGCPSPTVTFGGVPATNVVVLDGVNLRVTTPPHAAGAVEVRVTVVSVWSSYAFRYFDPAEPPSAKFFERVLVPVIYNGPGALGSNWVTELSLRNNNDTIVQPWHPIGGSSAIAPASVLRFGSGNVPGGLFLVVPRAAGGAMSFHGAVRDTSRSDREWGTEIPIVREKDFQQSVDLLDIPTDPRFRTMLRVYSLAPLPNAAAGVNIYSLADGKNLRSFFWPLSSCADAVPCADQPGFGAVADLTAGLSAERVGVRVTGFTPIWAFVTVTNNETQHVTVVSPH